MKSLMKASEKFYSNALPPKIEAGVCERERDFSAPGQEEQV